MKTKVYEKGIVKVVWVDIENSDKIYSKMFNDEASAKEFAQSKQSHLIFKLEDQSNMEEFSWKILPFGKYKMYKFLLKNYSQFSNLL